MVSIEKLKKEFLGREIVGKQEDIEKTMQDKIEKVLLEKRRLFLSDSVSEKSANILIRKLWYLDHVDNKKPILLVINSPGGSVDAGFAIWDQIKLIKAPVYTLITGIAASMGSILSLCAEKGRRLSTPLARVMIHQPLIAGVIQGQATDLDIQAKEMLKTRDLIVKIYIDATGKEEKIVRKAINRDNWMSAQEAKDFGLIDQIITSFDEISI